MVCIGSRAVCISIHALREEGDWAAWSWSSLAWNFYPRPPRGGRQLDMIRLQPYKAISIHALREEGDPASVIQRQRQTISIHALREEGDRG